MKANVAQVRKLWGKLVPVKNIKIGPRRRDYEYYTIIKNIVIQVEVVEIITTTVHPLTLAFSRSYEKTMYKLKNIDSNKILPKLRSYNQIYRIK